MDALTFILAVLLLLMVVDRISLHRDLSAERKCNEELQARHMVCRNALHIANQIHQELRSELADLQRSRSAEVVEMVEYANANPEIIQPTESGMPAESAP